MGKGARRGSLAAVLLLAGIVALLLLRLSGEAPEEGTSRLRSGLRACSRTATSEVWPALNSDPVIRLAGADALRVY